MNITNRIYIAAITLFALLMTGCGQTGSLYIPGHGSGYYRDHPFTERPVTAVVPTHQSRKKHDDKTNSN